MENFNRSFFKEQGIHGDLLFPMKIYPTHLDKNSPTMCLHWHDEMELIHVHSGSGNLSINLKNYPIKTGDLIIIPPQCIHSGKTHISSCLDYDAIVFHLDMLRSAAMDSVTMDFITPLIGGELTLPIVLHEDSLHYASIRHTLISIVESYQIRSPVYQLEIKASLFQLFALLYGHGFIQKVPVTENIHTVRIEKIKIAIQYILEHYNEDLPIQTLANLLQYSEYHFIRFFKEQTGFTCIHYINTVRLQNACELLLSTSLSVTEIALEVGFQNISYFIRTFKAKYNCTPNAYRKKYVSST
ncbi:AraC family transcriptional regulator [Sporanaerobium hydrogeniformans]|uniref:AraC family transcriptional regulator n=1 Tax=Sporanaerobium hydrogeniformans TaxID=3072179 RepID=A0AC61DBS0_9FIRM|nr:AraC family transcriptional regulator [Sporanaerobium hydrogeniformans]PHV70488.1 AraC family transcriptional regulator [Sporanaerobium hydrogeniformans]